jgi:hypothetical protein
LAVRYGDPLTRDPAVVHADLAQGVISAVAARDIYGIATSDTSQLDTAATQSRREALRRERLARSTTIDGDASIIYADDVRAVIGTSLYSSALESNAPVEIGLQSGTRANNQRVLRQPRKRLSKHFDIEVSNNQHHARSTIGISPSI